MARDITVLQIVEAAQGPVVGSIASIQDESANGLVRRLKWVGRHFGAFTLFGLLWALVAVVPGVVLVLLPMGVAGATRMVLQDDPGPPKKSE